MPTAVTTYVNSSAAIGGDGTYNLEAESGSGLGDHAYADLATWEAAEDGVSLVSLDVTHTVKCDRGTSVGTDTSLPSIQSWTTDATHWIRVEANREEATGFNTSNVFNSTDFYALSAASGDNQALAVGEDNVTIDGLQFLFTSTNGSKRSLLVGAGSNRIVENCRFKSTADGSNQQGIYVWSSTAGLTVRNCVFEDYLSWNTDGSALELNTGDVYLYNNTIHDCDIAVELTSGVATTDIVHVRNNLIFNCGTDLTDASTASDVVFDYNATDDPASGGGDPRGPVGQDLDDNTTLWDAAVRARASGDFRIDSEASLLYNSGISNGADSNVPLLDILGNVRHSDDIGAFAYSSTELRRFINLSAAGSGNGFTNYETSAAGVTAGYPANYHAHVDMSTWEGAEQADLVTDTNSHVVDCDMGSTTVKDTVAVTIDGWVISETYPLTVRGNRSSGTGFNDTGIWDPASYYTRSVDGFSSINHREASTTFDGLQIELAKNSASAAGWLSNTSVSVDNIIKNCLVSSVATYSSKAAVFIDGPLGNWDIYNNVFVDCGSGDAAIVTDCVMLIYNNTFYDCNRALNIRSSVTGAVDFKNNAVFNSGTEDYLDDGTGTRNVDYNATDDPASGTAVPRGPNGKDLNDNASSEWDNAVRARASDDFRIDSEASLLYNLGISNADDPNVPLLDILGNVRHSDDIGAFAYSSTEIRRFVNTSSAASGNGFTNYETSAAGVTAGYPADHHAFVDLATWEAAEQVDLVSATSTHIVDCSLGTTTTSRDTTNFTIQSWTTSATYFITIRGHRTSGDGFNDTGIFDASSFYTKKLTATAVAITPFDQFTVIDGIQLEHNYNGAGRYMINSNSFSSSDLTIKNCIFTATGAGATLAGGIGLINPACDNVSVTNCVFYDMGFPIYDPRGDGWLIYNCSFYGADDAIYLTTNMLSPHTFTVKNCLIINNTNDLLDNGGTATLTFDYNASDDSVGTNNVALNENASSEWDNAVTARASGDFTVKDASSLLYDAGETNTGDSNIPTTDYFGNARTTYDIGAFEFVASGDTGTGAGNLNALEATGSGVGIGVGTGAGDLNALGSTGAGVKTGVGTGASDLNALEALGAGVKFEVGSGTGNLNALEALGTGTRITVGIGAGDLNALEATGAGTKEGAGTGTGTGDLNALEASGAGLKTGVGTSASDLNGLESTGVGLKTGVGSGSGDLNALESSGAGVLFVEGSGAGDLNALESNGVGAKIGVGTSSSNLNALEASGAGTEIEVGTGAGNLNALSSTGVGAKIGVGTGAGALNELKAVAAGLKIGVGTSAGELNSLLATVTGVKIGVGSGAGNLNALKARGTDSLNAGIGSLNGLNASGIGVRQNPIDANGWQEEVEVSGIWTEDDETAGAGWVEDAAAPSNTWS